MLAQYERLQDAFLTGDDRAAMVQFRGTTVCNRIYRTDIQEIFEKLEKTVNEVISMGTS